MMAVACIAPWFEPLVSVELLLFSLSGNQIGVISWFQHLLGYHVMPIWYAAGTSGDHGPQSMIVVSS